MMWMSQGLFDKLKELLGGGDDIATVEDVMKRLENVLNKTPENMSLSREALTVEKSQLEADVAGLKSLAALKEGLINQRMGLPVSQKAASRNVPASDPDVTKQMLATAGGCEIRS